MKSPYDIIIRPHVTEKTTRLSFGDLHKPDDQVERSYTFVVANDANKLEIKAALEAIYNSGKKAGDGIVVDKVRTITVKGKSRRVNWKNKGKKPDWKKAIVTLQAGQLLEDYGV